MLKAWRRKRFVYKIKRTAIQAKRDFAINLWIIAPAAFKSNPETIARFNADMDFHAQEAIVAYDRRFGGSQ